MGISGFFFYLKDQKAPKAFKLTNEKKYDYLVLDYHSLFHNIKNLYEEINYFIRVLFKARYEYQIGNNYFFKDLKGRLIKSEPYLFIEKIHKTYPYLFSLIGIRNIYFDKSNLGTTISQIDSILSKFPVSEDNIKKAMINDIIQHTEFLARQYTYGPTTTLIYFDGIPSVSKIKEQLNRRISLNITKMINTNIVQNVDIVEGLAGLSVGPRKASESEIRSKLILSFPPINLNEPLINETRTILQSKGFIINNQLKYGEAEHQIMKDLRDSKFTGKNILLASPDADLILLSMLALVFNNVKIDIYRESIISPSSFEFVWKYELKLTQGAPPEVLSPYGRDVHFILIDELISSLNLNTPQKILDISYLILLLGDDFIPVISTLNVKALDYIITLYERLKLPIIDSTTMSINYRNITSFIIEFAKEEGSLLAMKKSAFDKKIGFKSKNANTDYSKYKKFMNIDENLTSKKIFYLEHGFIIKEDGNLEQLTKPFQKIESLTDDKIIKYLQGYQFIFDLYYNNNIKNYKWFYPHEVAPTLNEIATFLTTTKIPMTTVFDYTNGIDIKRDLNFFNLETYKKYIEDNKDKIIRNIIRNIIIEKPVETTDVPETMELSRANLEKYFTYDNLKIIYKCFNELYLQSCINYDKNLIDPDVEIYNTKIDGAMLKKYLKYKNKYIALKKKISTL